MQPQLTRSTKRWYALGQAAEGLKNEAFSLFLLFYYTQVVGLSGTLAGLAILLSLFFDAVTDPLAGVISDRSRSPRGRRHPFMYVSALPVAVSFYFVFAPPEGLGQQGLFVWLLTTLIFCRLFMTLFHVPHLALGAELSSDYEERTFIVMLRSVYRRIGHGTAGILGLLVFMRPTLEFLDGRLNPAAYPRFAATLAVMMCAIILTSAWRTRSRIPYLATGETEPAGRGLLGHVLRDMWEILHYRSFRALFFGSVSAFIAWGTATALALYLGTYFWQVTTDQMVLWGIGAGVGLFTGMFFWAAAARRLDKRPVWIIGVGVFTLFTTAPPLLKIAGWWPAWGSPGYIPAFVLTTGLLAHFGVAAAMVTGESMMADVTDEDALKHGRRREGIFFGAVSFAAKTFFGVGSQIAGWVVDYVGLKRGVMPDEVGPEVARDLGLTLCVTVALLVGLAMVILSTYNITRRRHAVTRAELSDRNRAKGAEKEGPL